MRAGFAGIALAMWLASGTAIAAPCAGFTDVDSANTTYCPAVTYLKDKGITLGCTGTQYCPNDYVTRLQMALFLQRAGRADPSNTLGDHTTTIGGGTNNTSIAADGYTTVSGGLRNAATVGFSTVGGGVWNAATAFYSTVAGGAYNTASGNSSAVLGGYENVASGSQSIAAGTLANADFDGCMVFADASASSSTSCGATNEFIARAEGGFFIFTAGADDAHYTGTYVPSGSSSWTIYSDRNGKTNVAAVDPVSVLERLSAIPVATWNWKTQPASIHHMGPMAQDFYAAFGLGETDKGISVVDAQGVALAAIQGLNSKVEARDAIIVDQARELAALSAQLAIVASQLERVEARLH